MGVDRPVDWRRFRMLFQIDGLGPNEECSIPSASACAGDGPPMNRERVDDTECERKAD
jgi:hypothetical protein